MSDSDSTESYIDLYMNDSKINPIMITLQNESKAKILVYGYFRHDETNNSLDYSRLNVTIDVQTMIAKYVGERCKECNHNVREKKCYDCNHHICDGLEESCAFAACYFHRGQHGICPTGGFEPAWCMQCIMEEID